MDKDKIIDKMDTLNKSLNFIFTVKEDYNFRTEKNFEKTCEDIKKLINELRELL